MSDGPKIPFFQALDSLLDKTLGEGKQGSTPFPPMQQGTSRYDVGGFGTSSSFNPGQIKDKLLKDGYVEPARDNPYAVDPAVVRSLAADKPSPYTVVDINPSQYGIDLRSGQAFPTSNQISQETKTQLINYFNISQTDLANLNSGTAGGDLFLTLARTISITGSFSSFRAEKITTGQTTNFQSFPNKYAKIPEPARTGIRSSISPPGNQGESAGNWYMSSVARALQGLFVQFDSPNAPLFQVKPGETHKIPFNTVYITFFVTDTKWRAICGNGASLENISDERILRQKLSIWDAGGIVENENIHPVPFALEPAQTDLDVGNQLVRTWLVSNYDSGAQIQSALPTTSQGQGKTSNHGYGVMWITSVSAFSVPINNATGQPWGATISLKKGMYRKTDNTITNPTLLASMKIGSNTTGVGTASINNTFVFPEPVRVVLAGFDAFCANATAPNSFGESGEVFYMEVDGTASNTSTRRFILVSINGYVMGWLRPLGSSTPATYNDAGGSGYAGMSSICCLPINPYPMDVTFDSTRVL